MFYQNEIELSRWRLITINNKSINVLVWKSQRWRKVCECWFDVQILDYKSLKQGVSIPYQKAQQKVWMSWVLMAQSKVLAAQWPWSMYRLVNLSRAPWDLVPSEARDHIEWRVKGLPTYLVHGSQEKLNSLCIFLFLKILLYSQLFHQLNSNYRQFVLKLNPNFL